ncbi:MAG: NAD kinase [Burkholderiaceae bacterium]|uniref:NAD kinase n=1 Tax=Herminiimonas contaminans TaxID=1111140 RepID=A0ABS0EN71_9BURK|nr:MULTISPECIES: NAD kinase [Oxalobacteraceae]MBF8176303.1 NAD kinase [Herminiimonas contaminans]MBX9800780.1 NAD kinase [Burkholderiaceae bacterium]
MSLTSHSTHPSSFNTIAIFGKHMAGGIAKSLTDIADCLGKTGRKVIFEAETALNFSLSNYDSMTLPEIGECADAAIVVGGDGTMLGIARQLAPYNVPLIGVNQGRLGFMTDISLDQMMPLLKEMLNGKVRSEQRSLLKGSIEREGEAVYSTLAFNDVVLSRGSGSGMVELRVEVDGHFMYNQRSDGLIVATPTGSSAYALSAGGPILHPSLTGIGLVPIAPHALSNRPIVVPDSSVIEIEVVGGREANVNFDMQSVARLLKHDRITVRRSEHTITFLHPEGWNYYDTLREKLHWNEYPSVEGRLK